MARYRKKTSRGKAKPALHSFIPLVVLGADAYSGYMAGGASEMANRLGADVTGYSFKENKFNPQWAVPFYGSIVGSYIGGKLIAMSGVNRAMKGLPFRL